MPTSKTTSTVPPDIEEMLGILTRKVDRVIDLLQDLLVLQAASLKATNDDIRKAFRLDMNRVSRISRLAKKTE